MIGKRENPWCTTCGEGTEETGTHITFECPLHSEHRRKAGNPREWKDLDGPVWVDGRDEEKYDAVLDLFWEIGRRLRTAQREPEER